MRNTQYHITQSLNYTEAHKRDWRLMATLRCDVIGKPFHAGHASGGKRVEFVYI